MIERVGADFVAGLVGAGDDLRAGAGGSACHEEGGGDSVIVEDVE